MKVLVVDKPGTIKMKEFPTPELELQEVLIRVCYCGICGTDFAICSGESSFARDGSIKYPIKIGHEFSGIIEKVGKKVTSFMPGDRVICDDLVCCGKCADCLSGKYERCDNFYSVGTINCWDGAFSEYIRIPEHHVYKLPDSVSLEEAALIEPATIAYNGVTACRIKPESRVLVIGTGCIGLSAVALIKTLYGATVYLSGRTDAKLEIGRQMGADVLINATREDVGTCIDKLTDGLGVDSVVEASGNISTINDCLHFVRKKSVIALIGFYEVQLNQFDIDRLVSHNLVLQGIGGGYGLPAVIAELLGQKRLSLMPLVTQRMPFDELPDLLTAGRSCSMGDIKVLVKIGSEDYSARL